MGEGDAGPRRVAVVMTCHNRRDTTIGCLEALRGQETLGVELTLFVTDDGSTDGTSEAIQDYWPNATILSGTDLYWAAGMALAERAAVAGNPDYLLWLNDDTVLRPGALDALLTLSAQAATAVIVGATADPDTDAPTYGGRVRIDYHPQRFRHLAISMDPQRADTFNGNVVLIPVAVRELVGPIDGEFPHAYADDDYGLRATALGVPIVQAPGVVATCRSNAGPVAPAGGLGTRWRHLQSPKGLPWRAQARYLRRHGDWRWPLILVGQQVQRLMGRWP